MPIDKDISIHLSCQQFECNRFDINETRTVLLFRSDRRSDEVACPFCGGRVHVYDSACTTLKDMPLWFGVPLEFEVEHHRYRFKLPISDVLANTILSEVLGHFLFLQLLHLDCKFKGKKLKDFINLSVVRLFSFCLVFGSAIRNHQEPAIETRP